jgi:phosphoadenosine phosphosulfate reductase
MVPPLAPPTDSTDRLAWSTRQLQEADDEAISALATDLEGLSAEAIVAWAIGRFPGRICVTSSMADTVMVHLVTQVDPSIEIVFLDTGFHFPQTIATLERATTRWNLNVHIATPAPDAPDLFSTDIETCCFHRKVATLERALTNHEAWMTGLRRSDSATRADTPIVQRDARGLIKFAPIATWTDSDVDAYIAKHRLIVNPLAFEGYLSIGCEPCTNKVRPGDDPRAGRWEGLSKTECGLHA